MKLKIKLTVLILFLSITFSFSQALTVTGTNSKTSNSQFPLLKCSAIALQKPGYIVSTSGDNNGFWINGIEGKIVTFNDPKKAIGYKLKEGIYWVYPILKDKQTQANVTVTFAYF